MGKRLTFGAYPLPLFRHKPLRVAQPEEEEMSETPDTDKRREEILREYGGIGGGAFAALYWYAQSEERELSTLRAKLEAGRNREQMYFRQRDEETARADAAEAKLAAAEKDAERKDAALRVARAAAIHGTTDGGKAVARMIDAAIEKERSRDC